MGKLYCGQGVYSIDPDSHSSSLEKVVFGVDDDADGLIKPNGEVIGKTAHRLESRISLLNGNMLYGQKDLIEAFDAAFMGNSNEVVLVVAISDANHPVEDFTTITGGGAIVQPSNHGQAFRALRVWHLQLSVALDAIYLIPSSAATITERAVPVKPLPTVVMVHGGPNLRITNALNTYYYIRRGERFVSMPIDGIRNYDLADIVTVTQYAIEKDYADRDRLLVAGWSQRGFLSSLCSVPDGIHGYEWQFQASIPGAGICDSDSMALTSDLDSVFQPDLNNHRVTWNMNRDDTRNRRACPLWEFSDVIEESKQKGIMIVPPMLILHGENDERCPLAQA
ncbi:hypothetical protein MMC18_001723 [Xylographa bjoerkii]|nr:hypothetical protein [Xylographa bjoerkii]